MAVYLSQSSINSFWKTDTKHFGLALSTLLAKELKRPEAHNECWKKEHGFISRALRTISVPVIQWDCLSDCWKFHLNPLQSNWYKGHLSDWHQWIHLSLWAPYIHCCEHCKSEEIGSQWQNIEGWSPQNSLTASVVGKGWDLKPTLQTLEGIANWKNCLQIRWNLPHAESDLQGKGPAQASQTLNRVASTEMKNKQNEVCKWGEHWDEQGSLMLDNPACDRHPEALWRCLHPFAFVHCCNQSCSHEPAHYLLWPPVHWHSWNPLEICQNHASLCHVWKHFFEVLCILLQNGDPRFLLHQGLFWAGLLPALVEMYFSPAHACHCLMVNKNLNHNQPLLNWQHLIIHCWLLMSWSSPALQYNCHSREGRMGWKIARTDLASVEKQPRTWNAAEKCVPGSDAVWMVVDGMSSCQWLSWAHGQVMSET